MKGYSPSLRKSRARPTRSRLLIAMGFDEELFL
jgi:hypothetical protein